MTESTVTEKQALCRGCRDDFYNDHNDIGVKQCWLLDGAHVVTRFRIGWWTAPTTPRAFEEVTTLSCWYAPGQFGHYEKLPDFAREPIRLRTEGAQ